MSVLPDKYSLGPHGLGDPDDKTLRKVEIEVMVPKMMREKARKEKCPQEVGEFEKCCKASSVFMVVTCRKENTQLKDCLTSWYYNDEFKKECTKAYLEERSQYRRTGVKKPTKRA